MSNTSMTATTVYLNPGSLLLITAMMMVILLALKLLLKEMSHTLIIVLSFGISFFLTPQGVTLLFQGEKAPAMQYIASGGVFAIIAISEVSYLIANWGRGTSPKNTDEAGGYHG